MYNDGALEREATINVDRGLYILRYASGATSGASPVAIARPAPGSEPFVEVISAPGVVSGFLSFPGECAIVRAEQSGRLSVKIMRQSAGASMDANFRLEPVFGAEKASAPASVSSPSEIMAPAAWTGVAPQFKLLAHVSRRGDVEVNAGDWVAGPSAPAAIEGVEIRGMAGSGLGVEIQPLIATNPLRWLDWVPAGVFAGSRGRALSLAGVRIRLAGEQASRYVIVAEASFLGSAIVSKRGREVELVGAAGGDPLVGLRLEIVPDAGSVVGNVAAANVSAQQRAESRVRVFRAAVGN